MSAGDLWRRGQHGWPASLPLVQLPNAPLLVAFAGLGIDAVAEGQAGDYGRATFYAGLAAWAWLELTDGANWVRRAAGAGGLVFVVARVGDALGA